MSLKNKTIKKFIPTVLIVFILMPSFLFSIPRKTNALPMVIVEDTSKTSILRTIKSVVATSAGVNTSAQTSVIAGLELKQWAHEILKAALTNLAKRFMAKMTESTVNWINSGFHGAPLFLERPESFFKDIAKSEIKNLVNSIGYDNSRFPFGKSFLINAINGYKSTFEKNAEYSLSRVTNDPALLESFREDFGTGGWDAFFINTQFQQNNYLGSKLMYSDKLTSVLAGTNNTVTDEIKSKLAQGQGFLSPQKCETNPEFDKKLRNQFQKPIFKCSIPDPVPEVCDPAEGELSTCIINNQSASINHSYACRIEKNTWELSNTCPNRPDGTSGFVNTTPGSVVADQIMNSLTSGKRQGELAIAMGNSLSAIFDALLNQLFQKGLNSLSSKKTPQAPADDFNYFGNTFNPSATTGTNNNFKWIQEREFNLENEINLYKTDGTEYINWKSPDDTEALQQINNTPDYLLPVICPVGQTGIPPNCVLESNTKQETP